jgi:hypothetical protein
MNLRGDHCQCAACGQYFNSTYAFDKHRVGDYTGRRCLTVDEMRAKGMAQKPEGWWISSIARGYVIQGKAIGIDPLPGEGV